MRLHANEIVITRICNAPASLVWDAWTQLEQVGQWWGPRGFSLTTLSKDLRPGGHWNYTMHGPDGTDYPNVTKYHEVVPQERLVYDHGGSAEREKLFTVTVTFRETKGEGTGEDGRPQTTMHMITALPTAEMAQAIMKHIREANGTSTWDRLGEFLEARITGKDVLLVHRSFRGPIKALFAMWTQPEMLARWVAPSESKMTVQGKAAQEGSSSRWTMSSPDGAIAYGESRYLTVRPESLLVYLQHFSDADERIRKPGFSATYPDTILTTVTFTQESPVDTRVGVQWEIHDDATEAERATFRGMKAGMNTGWNGSFDRLQALLDSA